MNNEIPSSDVVVFFLRRNEAGRTPNGTPALFSRRTGRVLEAPSQFLRDCFVRSGKARASATWRAAAYAIAAWWDFLESRDLEWSVASRDDLIAFRDFYLSTISPKTGVVYSANTVAYRMSIVGSFYVYHGTKGAYVGSILNVMTDESRPIFVESSLDHHRARRARPSIQLDSRIVPRSNGESRVTPYSKEDWQALTSALGRLPSQCADGEEARDRLIVEITLAMGLRVGEVAGLSVYPFAQITDQHEHVMHRFEVTGKGRRKRMVSCPGRIVNEVNLYIARERMAAREVANSREHGTLFVTGIGSPRPGRPLSIRRLEEIHAAACLRAGLKRCRDGTGFRASAATEHPRYRFHDLRHTFAVWMYSVLKMQGDPEPWKEIQAQLGHRSLQTTLDTYLRTVKRVADAFCQLSFGSHSRHLLCKLALT